MRSNVFLMSVLGAWTFLVSGSDAQQCKPYMSEDTGAYLLISCNKTFTYRRFEAASHGTWEIEDQRIILMPDGGSLGDYISISLRTDDLDLVGDLDGTRRFTPLTYPVQKDAGTSLITNGEYQLTFDDLAMPLDVASFLAGARLNSEDNKQVTQACLTDFIERPLETLSMLNQFRVVVVSVHKFQSDESKHAGIEATRKGLVKQIREEDYFEENIPHLAKAITKIVQRYEDGTGEPVKIDGRTQGASESKETKNKSGKDGYPSLANLRRLVEQSSKLSSHETLSLIRSLNKREQVVFELYGKYFRTLLYLHASEAAPQLTWLSQGKQYNRELAKQESMHYVSTMQQLWGGQAFSHIQAGIDQSINQILFHCKHDAGEISDEEYERAMGKRVDSPATPGENRDYIDAFAPDVELRGDGKYYRKFGGEWHRVEGK